MENGGNFKWKMEENSVSGSSVSVCICETSSLPMQPIFMTDITTDPCWWCELYESEKCIKTNL